MSSKEYLPENEFSERQTSKVSDRKQLNLPGTGLTKGEIKRNQEQSNKKPSSHMLKAKEKKAKAKEELGQRKHSEDFQANKAEWEASKVGGGWSSRATGCVRSNKRTDRKFEEAKALEESFD